MEEKLFILQVTKQQSVTVTESSQSDKRYEKQQDKTSRLITKNKNLKKPVEEEEEEEEEKRK